MGAVNVHEAKTHLSALLEKVESGEEVVIARAGKPIARLVPFVEPGKKLVFGLLKGRLEVPDGFDEPLPEEVVRQFEGE